MVFLSGKKIKIWQSKLLNVRVNWNFAPRQSLNPRVSYLWRQETLQFRSNNILNKMGVCSRDLHLWKILETVKPWWAKLRPYGKSGVRGTVIQRRNVNDEGENCRLCFAFFCIPFHTYLCGSMTLALTFPLISSSPFSMKRTTECFIPGLANFSPQEGHINHKDSPEIYTCVYTHRKLGGLN
jgi:hypothetical protein